jgi:hypothetical protein
METFLKRLLPVCGDGHTLLSKGSARFFAHDYSTQYAECRQE